ncbi:MAG: RelA/SpoT family protein, partial [Candidatus Paceibacterota bacterium]
MTDVTDIFKLMKRPPLESEKEFITKAYEFAKKAHGKQERNSGEPYFIHVFAVGKILARFGMDVHTIAAGLLHDTLEDTDTSEETLEKEFGKDIVFLVKGVTKLGKLKYRGRERHVESLRKFFIAMAEDLRVLIIKLADRLHNVMTLEHVREDKQKRIAVETIEIHAPLANRLGMGKLKGELEDHSFPYAFPKEYKIVEDLLAKKTYADQKFMDDVHHEVEETLKKQEIKFVSIDYRIKHKYSLYKKLLRYDMDIEKIHDIVALRVIVPTIEDCYRVLGIIHGMWRPLPGKIKDYIALPKPNGYQSLHTTVFTSNGGIAEIQIKTPQMHEEAEYGVASHFIYKETMYSAGANGNTPSKKFAWIGELKELQKFVAEPEKFLEHLRMDFFNDRIFIFTPNGDVVDLTANASP